MTDEKLVSAEEARGLLDATGRLSSPVLFTAKRWMVSEEEAAAMSAAGDLFAAAPDLARTVIALHARAERAERERDEARAERDRLARERDDWHNRRCALWDALRDIKGHDYCARIEQEAADAAREVSDG